MRLFFIQWGVLTNGNYLMTRANRSNHLVELREIGDRCVDENINTRKQTEKDLYA